MPQVRRLQREVSTSPLPGVRKTAGETPTSRGAGIAIAKGEAAVGSARALADLGGTVANVGGRLFQRSEAIRRQEAEQARQHANEVAVLNASNQLDAWELGTIHDPQHGALTVTGKAAFDLPEQVDKSFDEATGKIEQGLSTDEQRLAFAKLKANRHANVTMNVQRHVASEIQQYDVAEHNAHVNNRQSLAIANALDPSRVGVELQAGRDEIRSFGARTGMGADATQARVDAFQSNVHLGVIRNLLANEKDTAAGIYFEEAKGQIAGDKQDEILTAIKNQQESGSVRREGQRQSDAILAAGGTLTQQREKARAIDDPKVRDDVMARLEHESAVNDKAQRDVEVATLRTVYDTLDRTHDVTAIPSAIWAQMDPGERSNARNYAHQLAEGVPVKTDDTVFYGLMQQAMRDPQAFTKVNLLTKKSSLSSGDFQQLAGLQLSIANNDKPKVEKELSGFRTHTQIVDDSLTQYGIDPNAKANTEEGKAIAQLRRMLDVRVQAQEGLTGKKPTNDNIQRTLDSLLSQSVTVPGSWWNIFPGGKSFTDTQRPLYTLQVGDIPASDRKQIEDALRRARRPVSDATVLDLYLETRSRTGK